MSIEGALEQKCESVDAASKEMSDAIKNDEKMDYTEKFLRTRGDLKELETSIGSNKQYSNPHKDEIARLKNQLDKHFYEITNSKDPKLDDVIIVAESFISMYNITFMKQTTEVTFDLIFAEYYLTRSMTLLKGKELNRKAIISSIVTLNELSRIFKQQGPSKRLQYLNKALELYIAYTKGEEQFPPPVNILTVMGIERKFNSVHLLDRKYMYTLKSIIKLNDQVKHSSIDTEKIVTYMHKLLMKQMKHMPLAIDSLSWAMEVIGLAEYFLSRGRFVEAQNHLVVASSIMGCHSDFGSSGDTSLEKDKMTWSFTESTSYIIYTNWVKYGLTLLFISSKKLLDQEESSGFTEANNLNLGSTLRSTQQSTGSLVFECTEKEYKEHMIITTNSYIKKYNDAKAIFSLILELINKLTANSLMLTEAAVRIELAQYTSKAYKYLAFYEHDRVKQEKLHNQRIKVLQDCLETLNEEDDEINQCCIWLELATINSAILGLKMDDLDEDNLTAEGSVELDKLAETSEHYFQLYIKNVENSDWEVVVRQEHETVPPLSVRYIPKLIMDYTKQ